MMSLKHLFTLTIYILFTIILIIEAQYQLNENKKWPSQQKPLHNSVTGTNVDPPDYKKYAKMARFIVHESDYVSIATISTNSNTKGYPFSSIISMSDGPVEKGSGIPYMYTTIMDLSAQDLENDNRCTLMASLVQGNYCKDNSYDPEDPRCAHVILSGEIIKLKKGTDEYNYANHSLFERHPVMKTWPENHTFFFIKLNIKNIIVQDYFGGPQTVPLDEYLAVGLNNIIEEDYINFFDDYESFNENELKYQINKV